ncbi:hypothetical protein R1flu_029288 [Riccia fluitans]|uniref:Uncharacterized protein n=1 Tax=Riccia fluitans TaxID=41844 RepID=A0ABD1XP30_9MARC
MNGDSGFTALVEPSPTLLTSTCFLVQLLPFSVGRQIPADMRLVRGAIYYFKIAVALAVAAISEGFPAVVTTCLALGTKRMSNLNVIVRSLPSVETLGCTTVKCSDKTGIVRTNMMSISKVFVVPSAHRGPIVAEYNVTGTSYSADGFIRDSTGFQMDHPAGLPCLLHLSMCSALCNDSKLEYNSEKGAHDKIGRATSTQNYSTTQRRVHTTSWTSWIRFHTVGLNNIGQAGAVSYCNHYWEQQFTNVSVVEFSRDCKLMSVLCTRKQQDIMFCKGVLESILSRCSSVLCNDDGSAAPMTSEIRAELEQKLFSYGQKDILQKNLCHSKLSAFPEKTTFWTESCTCKQSREFPDFQLKLISMASQSITPFRH